MTRTELIAYVQDRMGDASQDEAARMVELIDAAWYVTRDASGLASVDNPRYSRPRMDAPAGAGEGSDVLRMSRQRMKIHVAYDPPPIPIRTMDWHAWDDDGEGEQFHGATAAEALQSLVDHLESCEVRDELRKAGRARGADGLLQTVVSA